QGIRRAAQRDPDRAGRDGAEEPRRAQRSRYRGGRRRGAGLRRAGGRTGRGHCARRRARCGLCRDHRGRADQPLLRQRARSLQHGGGVESMSRVPMGSSGGAWAMDPEVAFHTYFVPQGISADLVATKYGMSRTDVDAYAVESQKRAARAWAEGRFAKSIVPVKDINGFTVLERDEHMRPETTMQSLASLEPSFVRNGEALG